MCSGPLGRLSYSKGFISAFYKCQTPEGCTHSHSHTDPCGQKRCCTSLRVLILRTAHHIASDMYSRSGFMKSSLSDWMVFTLTKFQIDLVRLRIETKKWIQKNR